MNSVFQYPLEISSAKPMELSPVKGNKVIADFRIFLQKLNLWKTNSGTRSFHTLRHTYASHLLMSGVNIFIVSRWMGHSSVKVTEKNYGHLIPNSVEVKLPWSC